MEIKFKRFTINQRIEHIIFFSTFILLAYTGFPLKFPDEWWSKLMIASVGGFDNRTLIHHFSGLLMIGVCIYHVIYHVILDKPKFDILFNLGDIRDFKQQIKYYLRLSELAPRFGRYTWKQKFEYFGAGFGAIIMGFTGILMWNPFEAMKYFPIGLIQIANLFHTWEAVLASLAIFIGHFYDEHFDKFLNMSWLTGTISEEEMKHEHPLEYEEVIKGYQTKQSVEEHMNLKQKLMLKVGNMTFGIVFMVITIWMLWISYRVLLDAIVTYFNI
jgi:formate dehydrogenase subunit gamma